MFCPSCGVAIEPTQRFCNHCGTALQSPPVSPGASFPPPDTDQQRTVRFDAADSPPTQPVEVTRRVEAAPPAPTEQLIAVPAGEIPPVGSPEFDRLFGVEAFTVVPQTSDRVDIPRPIAPPPLPTADEPPGRGRAGLDELSALRASSSPGQTYRAVLMSLSIAAAVVTVLAAVTTVVRYRVSGGVVSELDVQMNDLSTNALVGAIIGAVLLVLGGAAAMSGRRFGAGLAGGAGLGLAGFMGWMAAEAISVVDTLKRGFQESSFQYRLSTTMDLGLWLAVAAAVLGAVVFFVAIGAARSDGRPGVPLTVGAIGMIGSATMALGPLLTSNGVDFVDNFHTTSAVGPSDFWKSYLSSTLGIVHESVPPITVWMRVVVLLLLIVGGFVGFVAGTRWGIGIALGSSAVALWQWATSALDAGSRPFGIAGGNRGEVGFAPHVVTTVGVLVVVVSLVAAAVRAYRPRSAAAATE